MKTLLVVGLLSTALSQHASWRPQGGATRLEYEWYADGRLAAVRAYRDDKKVGRHRAWWPGGGPRLDAWYDDDAYHGEYRTWYRSGRPYERRLFAHGREAGLQQSWTEGGELFLNYEVRGGRRYGLVNAHPCVPVGGGAS